MTLSSSEIEAYFDRISLPPHARALLYEGPDGQDALKAITVLQQHHMAAIPFENIDLHYSPRGGPSQDTDNVFKRVINQRRGGLCIQVTILFVKLLQSLGFDAYCTGGRLNAAARVGVDGKVDRSQVAYSSWTHVITLVKIREQKYFVEIAFNQNGSPSPAPLLHNDVVFDIYPRQRRMINSSIAIGTWSKPDQKLWRMQLRENANSQWMDVCCFAETEWTFMDIEILTAGLATLGLGWYMSIVLCYRVLLENELPVGYLLIQRDELRRCYKGETRVVQKFYSESDRVLALAKEFGIILSAEEREAIKGTATELIETDFDYYG